MRAEIRRLHSPDAFDLKTYEPPVPDDFSILVQIIAGPVGGTEEESFDLVVLTPKCLGRRVSAGPLSGRHLLIVDRYDYEVIDRWIRNAVGACEGPNWTQLAERLARIGHWEFEDYRE